MRALSPIEALRRSFRLLALRPGGALVLAVALLTSLFAVCCGLGSIAAPWFSCELLALQIGLGSARVPPRAGAWAWAGLVQVAAVVVLGSLAFLTSVALGPDVVLGDVAQSARPAAARLTESLAILFGAGALSLGLLVHFEHAPSLLVDRGGSLTAALLESARLVRLTGVSRTWATSIVAHALQLAPAIITGVVVISSETLASTIGFGLLLLPVMALSLALGQGMTVAGYLAVRPAPREPRGPATQVRARLLWWLLLVLVMTGPIASSFALLRPAPVAAGTLPAHADALLVMQAGPRARERYLADTALRLSVSEREVRVLASDGGGAGTLPLRSRRVEQVRVARAAPLALRNEQPSERALAIEVRVAGGATYTTILDEAGVRLDDSLGRRFAALLPRSCQLVLLLCLVWTALWTALVLPRQAEALDARADEPERAGAPGRRALQAGLWLAPPALVSAVLGVWSALA